MVATALLLWWWGRAQAAERSAIPLLVAAGFGAIALVGALPAATSLNTAARTDPAWNEAEVAALQAEGRPVLVYFTADWCLTCKVNEAAALDRPGVRQAFAAARVAVRTADWTRGDPAITRFLDRRGRAGVPLYLWYAPGKAEPEELPQILTPGMLIGRAKSAA
jgi:thiol:disulfide interchange protein